MPDEQDDPVTRALAKLKSEGIEIEDPRQKWAREREAHVASNGHARLNGASTPEGITPDQLAQYNSVLDDLANTKDPYQDDFSFEIARLKVDILSVYRIFSRKMEPKIYNGQTESIMVSCPNITHPDKNPSAWINSEKNQWYCGACQTGGDSMHLAAAALGVSLDLKDAANYRLLLEKMAPYVGFPHKVVGLDGRTEFLRDSGVAVLAPTEATEPNNPESGTSTGRGTTDASGLRVGTTVGDSGRTGNLPSVPDRPDLGGDRARLGQAQASVLPSGPQDVQLFSRASAAPNIDWYGQGRDANRTEQVVPGGVQSQATAANFSGPGSVSDNTAGHTAGVGVSAAAPALGEELAALLSADPGPDEIARIREQERARTESGGTDAGGTGPLKVLQGGNAQHAHGEPGTSGRHAPHLKAVPNPEPEPVTLPDKHKAPGSPEAGKRLIAQILHNPPAIDWRTLLPSNTFLYKYVETCSADDIPEEYHFWNGLVAIGLMLGRRTMLHDHIPAMGNLFVCTVGPSGTGKSKATRYLKDLMNQAAPLDWNNPLSTGVAKIIEPGSGEALVHAATRSIPADPNAPKGPKITLPVTGFVEFGELSSLTERRNRIGSTLSGKLIEFYDGEKAIGNHSITSGRVVSENSFVSVITTTQPDALGTLLSSQDMVSGFVNRFVFAMGPAKPQKAFGGAVIDLSACAFSLQMIGAWSEVHQGTVFLTQDALRRYEKFWVDQLQPIKLSEQAAVLNRLDLLCKKLLLLLCANDLADFVSVEVVEQMIALFPYLLETYGVIRDKVGNTVYHELTSDLTSTIMAYCTKDARGPTMRDLNLALKHRKYTTKQLNDAMMELIKADEVTCISYGGSGSGQPGRPTKRYTLN